MDTLDHNYSASLALEDQARSHLLEMAKWGKILAIVGFVMIGLMVLGGISMLTFASAFDAAGMGVLGGASFFFIYLVLAGLYVYPTLRLYQFSTTTKRAIPNMDSAELTVGLGKLKSVFKFMGMLTVIIIGFYVLMIVISLLVGGLGMLAM